MLNIIFKLVIKSLANILKASHVGDWFVLYQLSKNVDSYFFRMFINELEKDLNEDTIAPPFLPEPTAKPQRPRSNRRSFPPVFLRPNKSSVSIDVESASDSEAPRVDEEFGNADDNMSI